MSRDLYETTVALPDATGTMKVLTGIKVSVVPRGAQDVPNSLVDVFASDTGATRGPDPKSGATGTNPMTTTASGSIRFWAEGPAELDLVFEDTQAPARITDRIGWNAIPAKAGSIPTAFLAEDAGITQKMLSAITLRQQVPIGAVIEWWRPVSGGIAVPIPDGYEVADGHNVNQHDFLGVSGAIALPNLQNVFILGASLNKADGAGADQGNLATQGPGIRGTGGTNAAFNFAHTHGVPGVDHSHVAGGLIAADHLHSAGTLFASNHARAAGGQLGGSEAFAFSVNTSPIGGATGPADRPLVITGSTGGMNGGAAATNAVTNSQTWVANPGADFRPLFYGLLRLIKVRRS